jgi:FixJ family two-component response regulator
VIVCDQRMPIMSGTEFLSKVKDMYPDTIRIILSGYTGLEAMLDSINRGAIYRFYTKPWDDVQLRDNIRLAFHHYWLMHGSGKHAGQPGEDHTALPPPAR